MLSENAGDVGVSAGMSLFDMRSYLTADGCSIEEADNFISKNNVAIEDLGDDDIIALPVCWRIFQEHAAVAGDEMHGVATRRLKPGITSLLVARMLLCDTLYEALQAYSASVDLVVPSLEFVVSKRGEDTALRWRFKNGPSDVQQLALECTAVVYAAVFAWLIQKPLEVLRVTTPAGRKCSSSTILRSLNAPVVFVGDALEIHFPTEIAEREIVQTDIREWQDGVYKILCRATMQPNPQIPFGQFTNRVRTALLQGQGQKQLAARWGLSTKTIARRLSQEGYSFRRLKDEIRMEKAASLIHAGLSVEEIGHLVGYQDPRSFRRAFVRWFGLSPSAYRSRRGTPEESQNTLHRADL